MSAARTKCLIAALALCGAAQVHAQPDLRGKAAITQPDIPPVDDAGRSTLLDAARLRAPDGDVELDEKSGLRMQSLRSEARAYGERLGHFWRAQRIEAQLRDVEIYLDRIYHFGPLMIEGVVLPPVVSQHDDGFRVENPTAARSTGKAYRIEHAARIVVTVPTWRDFLRKVYTPPVAPNKAIWPKTDQESAEWNEHVRLGWADGVRRADAVFEASLSLLTRTYKGMLTFHELARADVIKTPHVTKTEQGIVIEDASLDVGSVIYRIEDPAKFVGAARWKARLRETSPP